MSVIGEKGGMERSLERGGRGHQTRKRLSPGMLPQFGWRRVKLVRFLPAGCSVADQRWFSRLFQAHGSCPIKRAKLLCEVSAILFWAMFGLNSWVFQAAKAFRGGEFLLQN